MLLISAAVRALGHSLLHTVPFSSPLFLATVTTCLSHHTQAMSPPKQHIAGFHIYACLYGFPFAPAFYGTVAI